MKVLVNYPLHASRLYLDDFAEETIPNIGDNYDNIYVVKDKTVNGDICILDLVRRKNNE